ncbi:MAG: hypothetical protein PHX70_00590 [Clostridium sp.]|nr:hypothetical protein [Clostridium sp.]
MIQIVYLKEKYKLKSLPREIQEIILSTLKVLDSTYGANRNEHEDDGGYVIVVEKKEDFKELKSENDIDCDDIIPEYVDKITCSSGEIYTNSLILCNNDFGISLIIPMELTPQNLKNYIID